MIVEICQQPKHLQVQLLLLLLLHYLKQAVCCSLKTNKTDNRDGHLSVERIDRSVCLKNLNKLKGLKIKSHNASSWKWWTMNSNQKCHFLYWTFLNHIPDDVSTCLLVDQHQEVAEYCFLGLIWLVSHIHFTSKFERWKVVFSGHYNDYNVTNFSLSNFPLIKSLKSI